MSLGDVLVVYVFLAGLAVGAVLGYLVGFANKGT